MARPRSRGSDEMLAPFAGYFREEVDRATTTGQHIRPKTLTPAGDAEWPRLWPELLKEAMTQKTEQVQWLTLQLFVRRLFIRRSAAEQVAEHHFLRFFSAAACRIAIDEGLRVHYVRARPSQQPRAESERLLAHDVHEDPKEALTWLRSLNGFHHSPLGRYRTGLMLAPAAG